MTRDRQTDRQTDSYGDRDRERDRYRQIGRRDRQTEQTQTPHHNRRSVLHKHESRNTPPPPPTLTYSTPVFSYNSSTVTGSFGSRLCSSRSSPSNSDMYQALTMLKQTTVATHTETHTHHRLLRSLCALCYLRFVSGFARSVADTPCCVRCGLCERFALLCSAGAG